LSSTATIECFSHGEIAADGTTIRACAPRRIARMLVPFEA
jgi:hypothetical protein